MTLMLRVHSTMARRHRCCAAVSVMLLASLLGGCGKPAEAPAAPAPATPILQGQSLRFPAGHPHLAMLTAVEAAAPHTLAVTLPARLVWNEEKTQRIYPAFAGRVQRIHADVGQRVASGATLLQLASPDFGTAQADVARARTDLQLAQKAEARQKELFDLGIVARKDLEQAQADTARAQTEAARATARTQLYGGSGATVNQQLALTAQVGGIVVERNVNPGQELRPELTGPGVPPLFVISDPASLWVQVDAREVESAFLRPGTTFQLEVGALPGKRFPGVVKAVADLIDPTSRTIKVRGQVANPDRLLKAEMLATAHIEAPHEQGVLVPATAVLLFGARHRVFVQTSAGVYEPREVTLGYEGPKEVLVTKGLAVGEKVVSENTLLLARQLRSAREAAEAVVKATSQAEASGKTKP